MDREDTSIQQILFLKSSLETTFFKGMMHRFDPPQGLNFTHIRTLMILNALRECTMSKLSAMLLLEKGSFTPVANRLISLDYIKKKQGSQDKRKFFLKLTKKGKELARRFGKIHRGYMEEQLAELPPEEQKEHQILVARILELHQKIEASSK